MNIVISQKLQKILNYARDEALRTGCPAIGVDHLMLALLRDRDAVTAQALGQCGIDATSVKSLLDGAVSRSEAIPYSDIGKIVVSKAAGYIVGLATAEALRCGLDEVEPRHLLLAIAKGGRGESAAILAPHTASLSEILDCRDAVTVTPRPQVFHQIIRLRPNNEYPS